MECTKGTVKYVVYITGDGGTLYTHRAPTCLDPDQSVCNVFCKRVQLGVTLPSGLSEDVHDHLYGSVTDAPQRRTVRAWAMVVPSEGYRYRYLPYRAVGKAPPLFDSRKGGPTSQEVMHSSSTATVEMGSLYRKPFTQLMVFVLGDLRSRGT